MTAPPPLSEGRDPPLILPIKLTDVTGCKLIVFSANQFFKTKIVTMHASFSLDVSKTIPNYGMVPTFTTLQCNDVNDVNCRAELVRDHQLT